MSNCNANLFREAVESLVKKSRDELENRACYGKASPESLRHSLESLTAMQPGYEHIHVDYFDDGWSLLDKYVENASELDKEKLLTMGKDTVNRIDEAMGTVIVNDNQWGVPETPQYEGHSCASLPTKCTCDIMLLMAQGCKCGWLDFEKKAQTDAAFEKERHDDLNSGGW